MLYVYCGLAGILAGVMGGMFGVGGGIVIVPFLILAAGMTQHSSQGTSLVALSFPVAAMAAYHYWKDPDVKINLTYGIIIAVGIVVGGYGGSLFALGLEPHVMRKSFAVFLVVIAAYLFFKK